MLINEPVEDEEAQFDLVEDERAMCMVGGDPNPPFRLLRVPGDSFVKRVFQATNNQTNNLGCQMGFCLPTASRA